jgi:hypothetical protein
VNDANCLGLGEAVVTPEQGCRIAEAFVNAQFQDAPDVPPPVRAFWREARDELDELRGHGAHLWFAGPVQSPIQAPDANNVIMCKPTMTTPVFLVVVMAIPFR